MTQTTSLRVRITELERLESVASRAPWKASPPEEKADAVLYAHDGTWLANVGNWARCDEKYGDIQIETVETEHQANADLIAAARNALPTLLALARLAIEAAGIMGGMSSQLQNEFGPPGADSPEESWFARFDALHAVSAVRGRGAS